MMYGRPQDADTTNVSAVGIWIEGPNRVDTIRSIHVTYAVTFDNTRVFFVFDTRYDTRYILTYIRVCKNSRHVVRSTYVVQAL
jgi:hypothetical protein